MSGFGEKKFYKNDGTLIFEIIQISPVTEAPSASDFVWSRSGYSFVNWNTQSDSSGETLNAGARAEPGNAFFDYDDFYAIWEADEPTPQQNTEYIAMESELTSIANAIRTKAGLSVTLEFPSDFVQAIMNIPTGTTPTGTKNISISAAGTTTEDVTQYASAAITVPAGSEGTPVATKGTVSNHSVSVTPSVQNQSGFIAGQTKTGTPVTVAASELVSGTKSITANGTGIDVTEYAAVDVNVPTGVTPTGTKNISITQNGTTTEDVTNYASASIAVNVPNSYSASDEGKVVSNGALVAQTSDTVTQNGTVDTTLINSLLVNVSGGGGGASTVKAGEFTATSVGAMSIDTGYTGTGYPLAFAIIEMGGIIPGTKVPGYSLYAKIRNDITPPSSYNFVYGFAIRCGSTGNEGQSMSSGAAIMYSLNSPMDNQNLCAIMSNAKTLRIYCGDTGTSFKTNKRYCYVVAYSDAG